MTEKNQKVVFIPKKLKIGFVDQEETELGQLAFVTCFDEKGVQLQEKSFNSWRDHKIETQEWTNEPIEGFRIASNIISTPYGFGEKTEKIRVIDPRGAEFEISVENLIFILDNSDIINQEITSELIYAWDREDLMLLPTNSSFYKENVKVKIKGKFKAKDLKIGSSYLTNDPIDTAIYLGEFYYLPIMRKYFYKSSIDEVIEYHKNKDKIMDEIIRKGVVLENYVKAFKKQHLFMIKRVYPAPVEKQKANYLVQPLTIANIKWLKEECSELSEQQIEEINELWNFLKTKPTENIKNEELKLNSYYYEKVDGLEFYTNLSCFWDMNENNTKCVDLKSKIHSAKTKNDPVRIALEAQDYKIKKIFNVEKMCQKDKTFTNNGEIVYTDVKYLVFGDVEVPVKNYNRYDIM